MQVFPQQLKAMGSAQSGSGMVWGSFQGGNRPEIPAIVGMLGNNLGLFFEGTAPPAKK